MLDLGLLTEYGVDFKQATLIFSRDDIATHASPPQLIPDAVKPEAHEPLRQ